MIDLLDGKTGKLVWRAYIVAQGSGMNDASFIQKAVNKALEHYPPPANASRVASVLRLRMEATS